MNIRDLMQVLEIDELVGLDFETYFAKDYSLRSPKISTSEYVRDPRFKAHCVGIRTSRQRKARWYPHEQIPEVLAQFDWSRTGLLAHNAAFDGFICSQHYRVIPAAYVDTLSMARPLFSHDIGAGLDEVAKYLGYTGKTKADALQATKDIRDLPQELLNPLGEYCADDVNDMWSILRDMLAMDFPAKELKVIERTIRCFAHPVVEVDVELARKELQREIRKTKKLFRTIGEMIGESDIELIKKELSSNDKFAKLLRQQGVEPPLKPSPSDPAKRIYAFAKSDLDFQALEHHKNKNVRLLYEARLHAKSTIDETRAARMIARGTTGDGKLPLMLNYGKARTLRWSGGDKFNPQNFRRGGALRRCIKAPQGYRIGVADSSQIEARTNAWLWEEDALLEVFRTGGDPYADLASDIYGFKVNKKEHPMQRFVGKAGILGLGYQMGAPKFQLTLAQGVLGPPVELPIEECEKAVRTFRNKYRRIVGGWEYLNQMLYVMMMGAEHTYKDILMFYKDAVATISGFSLMYPNLRATYNPRRDRYDEYNYKGKWNSKERRYNRIHIYGGKLDENIVQHLARMIVAEQAMTISDRYRLVSLTHDEVIFLFHWRERSKAMKFAAEAMRTPPDWCPDIPLDVEYGYDKVYSK